MKIESIGLNKNERFCCSARDIKNIFGDSNITVNFGVFGGRHCGEKPGFYRKYKIKGKIVALLSKLNLDRLTTDTMLSFYVLKDEEYSEPLRLKFVSDVLPVLYERFTLYEQGSPDKLSKTNFLYVELYNGQFILHEGTE